MLFARVSVEYDAVIVGSGPNGLAAAITLARQKCSVLVVEANSSPGGGARSAELTLPGFVHDLCSAIHPLAASSPFFQALPLERYGLHWIEPEIALAHPVSEGSTAVLRRSINETANSLGPDARAYRLLMSPLARDWEGLKTDLLRPMLRLPRHPLALARFGAAAICPGTLLAKTWFKGEPARALLAGMTAHSFLPLETPLSSAFALVLAMAGHDAGWPMPRGGAQSITDSLIAYLRELGGGIELNRRIDQLENLPKTRVVLLDLTIPRLLQLLRNKLPHRYRARLQRFRPAPGVFKVDYALSAPVPWRSEECRHAGTVHLGGTIAEIAASERSVANGKPPERPFVLVAQQSLFDPRRAPHGSHTLWTYCHVPHGSSFDMSERIEDQIERFAPGFRDCVLARHSAGPADLQKSNANLQGGDINGGAANLAQMLARPVFSSNPYRTPLPGVYICSSSTPPGGGVHGMCGYHAANLVLQDLLRPPSA